MPIEDIVPPPELCAKIPDGAFAESSLIWFIWERNGEVSGHVIPREMKDQFANALPMILAALHKEFPAPTLEEILREMAKHPHRFNNLTCDAYEEMDFGVTAFVPYRGKPGSTLTEYRDGSGATAALKLYMHRSEK